MVFATRLNSFVCRRADFVRSVVYLLQAENFIRQRRDYIAKLLSGVESAFVTSLVGIGGGIIYNIAHHKLIVALHDKIAQLTDALDEKFPHRSVEDWLSKNFSEAQVQTTTLQSIDTESKEQTSALKNIGIDAKLKTADDIAKLMNEQMLTTLQELREALRQQAADSKRERDADY